MAAQNQVVHQGLPQTRSTQFFNQQHGLMLAQKTAQFLRQTQAEPTHFGKLRPELGRKTGFGTVKGLSFQEAVYAFQKKLLLILEIAQTFVCRHSPSTCLANWLC